MRLLKLFALILAFLSIFLTNSSAYSYEVHEYEKLVIDFSFDGVPVQTTGTPTTEQPDYFEVSLSGSASLSLNAATYSFYDGDTLLNTYTKLGPLSWFGIEYVSELNYYPVFYPEREMQTVDFTNFYDGSINGRLEIMPYFNSIQDTRMLDVTIAPTYAYQTSVNQYSHFSDPIISASVVSTPSPVVPEPISSTLFLIGGATLGFRRFRKSA